MNPKQKVLCVKRDTLVKLGVLPFDGFKPILSEHNPLFAPEHYEVVERGLCETDPSYKQIIPYVLCNDISGPSDKFLVYERKGAEARLHGLLSAGVGGHVETEQDHIEALSDIREELDASLEREIEEEAPFVELDGFDLIGLINHEDTEVGSVHLGLLYIAAVHPIGTIHNTELLNPRWMTTHEMAFEKPEVFERWTQYAIKGLEWLHAE
jgi:predicted NUDIX family phosphoesterase